jgi:hypothetical protein
VNRARYTRSSAGRIDKVVSGELERTWKRWVVAYFSVFLRYLPGGTQANREEYSSGLPMSWPVFEPAPPRSYSNQTVIVNYV